jgi:hypothetical protein
VKNGAKIQGVVITTLIKKENQIFLIYKEIQNGELQSPIYMTNGLLIYGEIFAHFHIYLEALLICVQYDFATAPI